MIVALVVIAIVTFISDGNSNRDSNSNSNSNGNSDNNNNNDQVLHVGVHDSVQSVVAASIRCQCLLYNILDYCI